MSDLQIFSAPTHSTSQDQPRLRKLTATPASPPTQGGHRKVRSLLCSFLMFKEKEEEKKKPIHSHQRERGGLVGVPVRSNQRYGAVLVFLCTHPLYLWGPQGRAHHACFLFLLCFTPRFPTDGLGTKDCALRGSGRGLGSQLRQQPLGYLEGDRG